MVKLQRQDYQEKGMLLDAPPISLFCLGAIQLPLLMVKLSHKSYYGRGMLLDVPPSKSLLYPSDSFACSDL